MVSEYNPENGVGIMDTIGDEIIIDTKKNNIHTLSLEISNINFSVEVFIGMSLGELFGPLSGDVTEFQYTEDGVYIHNFNNPILLNKIKIGFLSGSADIKVIYKKSDIK